MVTQLSKEIHAIKNQKVCYVHYNLQWNLTQGPSSS
jgi:hypothetical protein